MIQRRQLLVRHRALDPTAWTALVTLGHTARAGRPVALARADLWEFEWAGSPDLVRRLEKWASAANWFANPNRDRATWRAREEDPTDLEAGAALADGGSGARGPGAFLVTVWRGARRSLEHEAAASRALGTPLAVRHGQVWWLCAEDGGAETMLAAAGGGPTGGLLAHLHAQAARLYGEGLPVPAIWDEADDEGESA
jgi:hypothetical protein